MNRRKQVLFLQLLCSFLFGMIITIFVNVKDTTVQSIKEETETIGSMTEMSVELEQYVVAMEETTQTEINTEDIVNTITKSTPVAKIVDFDFASSNKLLRNRMSLYLAKIIAIEPRYDMSYYNDLLNTEHIGDLVTKRIHHMGVALRKEKRIRYVNNFISEAHIDDVVWEHVKGLDATDSSP